MRLLGQLGESTLGDLGLLRTARGLDRLAARPDGDDELRRVLDSRDRRWQRLVVAPESVHDDGVRKMRELDGRSLATRSGLPDSRVDQLRGRRLSAAEAREHEGPVWRDQGPGRLTDCIGLRYQQRGRRIVTAQAEGLSQNVEADRKDFERSGAAGDFNLASGD